MHNNIYQQRPEYKTGLKTDCTKLGGLNKSHRIINTRANLEAIEAEFMRISLKANRADKQREERRNKRK